MAETTAREWQPIESAPKNQDAIDLYSPVRGRIPDAIWAGDSWREWGLDSFDNMAWLRIEEQVTHWMRVPAPPVTP